MKWKAEQQNYDFIFEQPEDEMCVALTYREALFIEAALNMYNWKTRWHSPTNQPIVIDDIQALVSDCIRRLQAGIEEDCMALPPSYIDLPISCDNGTITFTWHHGDVTEPIYLSLVDCGLQGEQGEPGEKGDKGDKGDTGDAGAPGADGADGTDGIDGTDGLPGADGADGADGIDGTDGAAGRNGYGFGSYLPASYRCSIANNAGLFLLLALRRVEVWARTNAGAVNANSYSVIFGTPLAAGAATGFGLLDALTNAQLDAMSTYLLLTSTEEAVTCIFFDEMDYTGKISGGTGLFNVRTALSSLWAGSGLVSANINALQAITNNLLPENIDLWLLHGFIEGDPGTIGAACDDCAPDLGAEWIRCYNWLTGIRATAFTYTNATWHGGDGLHQTSSAANLTVTVPTYAYLTRFELTVTGWIGDGVDVQVVDSFTGLTILSESDIIPLTGSITYTWVSGDAGLPAIEGGMVITFDGDDLSGIGAGQWLAKIELQGESVSIPPDGAVGGC